MWQRSMATQMKTSHTTVSSRIFTCVSYLISIIGLIAVYHDITTATLAFHISETVSGILWKLTQPNNFSEGHCEWLYFQVLKVSLCMLCFQVDVMDNYHQIGESESVSVYSFHQSTLLLAMFTKQHSDKCTGGIFACDDKLTWCNKNTVTVPQRSVCVCV